MMISSVACDIFIRETLPVLYYLQGRSAFGSVCDEKEHIILIIVTIFQIQLIFQGLNGGLHMLTMIHG